MIDIKSLRLGNWVKVGDQESIVDYLNLDSDGIGLQGNGVVNRSEEVEGIPLTEIVIAKCGFGRKNHGWIWQPDWQNIEYRLVFFNSEWILSRGFSDYSELVPIKFLHRLQNVIYALEGQELIIK